MIADPFDRSTVADHQWAQFANSWSDYLAALPGTVPAIRSNRQRCPASAGGPTDRIRVIALRLGTACADICRFEIEADADQAAPMPDAAEQRPVRLPAY